MFDGHSGTYRSSGVLKPVLFSQLDLGQETGEADARE
jgi:hypothetical protein